MLEFKAGDNAQIKDRYLEHSGQYGVDDMVRIKGWRPQVRYLASYN